MFTPKGFRFAGVHCKIKKKRRDLGIIFSEAPCVAAGVFTTNVVKAAPVIYDMEILKKNPNGIRAIVVNSGVANACTGEQGMINARRMAEKAAEELGVPVESVLVSSTGVIGVQLPMDKVENGIEEAVKVLSNDPLPFAEAIMTTDTKVKMHSTKVTIDGKEITVLGIAKGSGMIHPNMATMLSFITTDAKISEEALKKLLKLSVDDSYNMIDVDGDTSTNDMVIVLANGLAGNTTIQPETDGFWKLYEAVHEVNQVLAEKIVEDGEGATKVMEVHVVNAPDMKSARLIARSIVSSNLVKTAVYGEDANWGRIIAAAGYSGATFDPDKLDLFFESEAGRIKVAENGQGVPFDEEEAKKILSEKKIRIILDMKQGKETAKAWGCDLTEKYVEINGRYRT
ncbi:MULTISPECIES: bifunctional glutamate N-acetyltransferase/amino-acid acetyltransferase ArgJ [unclassified Thermotoga]|uniref:bifunctional glutamate N-acetyltransferase/amino-acid acetyltransferase ArgJ n=1 Tax=unclassified Thermotoga TaxID=2631113 RepID=UPI000540A80B|nr:MULTISPECIES: bifunctional glutamate N-acetyltransferase/amino-acid acetyltransferase ArgJ [unclassified Thermotoga]AIY88355.1 bifunctional ornithine acetyltransferase/N-acetylglutamate synthase protein [Thermotoga sp. Cell2]KHC95227.1 bifunctional ornithine acetyltransferase/N-acetylglutamate synthase protein [Thermotoga sp. TBGT1765]KHC95376.1 bifunctional ornithine acetyltransferase/N-acetylglutamate synthase protein [Thermotoga sp. TBGT1766]KHC97114.1 bifunctional ornithine acetyltransfe